MKVRRHTLVLSIYLNTKGFAFVLFEGTLSPFDWGVHVIRGFRVYARTMPRIDSLLRRYQPDALVLREISPSIMQRAERVIQLNHAIRTLAEQLAIPVFAYSRADINMMFRPYSVTDKHDLAQIIAQNIPAFERYLPPKRPLWKSEDARMGLFDAAAQCLVFFQREARAAQ